MSAEFSEAGYAALLAALADKGYRAVGFGEADPAARHLLLRHDVDMSIQAAVRIAKLEAEHGVAATYFVLLRTEMYNPWSEANRADLDRIAAAGHEIGLHFDASLYAQESEALDAACAVECAALEAILDAPVRTISFHRPAKALQGRAGAVGGRRHAYEPQFFSDMGYCSDSRGGWHHGRPLDHPAVAAGRALQLLTHPIWWAAPNAAGLGPVATLDAFRAARDAVLAEALAANCAPYRDARARRDGQLKREADHG